MSNKKTKKSFKTLANPLLWGIPTNIAAGPLGFRAELGVNAGDGGDPRPSRIIFNERESESLENLAPQASVPSVVSGGAEPGVGPTDLTAVYENREESEPAPPLRVPEEDPKIPALGGVLTSNAAGGFGPLKSTLAALSAICADHERTVAIRNKVEDLLPRVAALEACFDSQPVDVIVQRQRGELIRKSGDIEKKLRFFLEKPEPQLLADLAQGHGEVFGVLEDLREAVFDYQVARQKEMYEQECKLMDPAEAAVLNNFRSTQGTEHRHGDRKGCLKGTRGPVLDEIGLWARNFSKSPVYWLNGLAGTGKSTIAQTVAERLFADGRLGASFFCSRDFEDRSNLQLIFPTLAVQLARNYAGFRSIFVPLVRSDPGAGYESLYNQMNKLIVQPLKQSGLSTTIIIDALDECKDREPASAILSVLGRLVSQVPKVKFFLTGRPEPRIREGFRLPLLAEVTDVFLLHDVEPSLVNTDILLYFKQSFQEVSYRRQGLENWPTKEQLDFLCERAAGLFVYAVATVKFLDGRNSNPRKRLDLLLRLPKSSAQEGKTKYNENTTLDSLYTSILQEAFSEDDPEDDPRIRSVLGAVVLAANPLSPSTIATLLDLDVEDVVPLLSSVHSLLILHEDVNHPVRPFHKSFPDFIMDPTRCINHRFHIPSSDYHFQLLIGSLELMGRMLQRNMCKLPEAVTNSEVDDLQERAGKYISPPLQYACRSWHKHFVDGAMVHQHNFTSAFCHFLEKKVLFWLEVLSVLGTTREAVVSLGVASRWLKESPMLNLINDYFKFVTTFFEVINESAQHVYHSALPLSPQTSIIQQQYKQYAQPLTRTVHGIPDSWDLSATTKRISSDDIDSVISWSPCSQYIAATYRGVGEVVYVLDPMTLDQLTILRVPLTFSIDHLFFSPDSNMVACYGHSPDTLVTFDLQTGGLVSSISLEHQGPCDWFPFHTFSLCGTMVVSLQTSEGTSIIHTYNIISGKHISSLPVELDSQSIWACDEHLQLAALEPGFITIWEVGFTSEYPATKLASMPTPSNFDLEEGYLFFPALHLLAFYIGVTAYVWDAQDSRFLLEFEGESDISRISLTSDGGLACFIDHLTIYLWKKFPSGYLLHKKIMASSSVYHVVAAPSFSPDGEFLAVEAGPVVQVWHTKELAASSGLAQDLGEKIVIIGFSPDGSSIATAQYKDDTVTVLSLNSGAPQLIIDAGLEICGLQLSGGTIVVVGDEKIIAWTVPIGDCTRVTVEDCAWVTAFGHPTLIPKASRFKQTASISPDLHHMATIIDTRELKSLLYLYDVHTGQCLKDFPVPLGSTSFFALDGHALWCSANGRSQGWSWVMNDESDNILLEDLEPTHELPEGCPWRSSCGYQITGNGWILDSSMKHLLWLPPHWQPDEKSTVWNEQFLAFSHRQLPEVIVLELLK